MEDEGNFDYNYFDSSVTATSYVLDTTADTGSTRV